MKFDAVAQALNYRIQSEGPDLLKEKLFSMRGTKIERFTSTGMSAGEIRMNIENQRYVELLHWADYSGTNYGTSYRLWYVEDILTGHRYELKPRSIGSVANEMEVLAWAAKT